MTAWLKTIETALDERTDPVFVFVRDDDGGRDDPALTRLMDLFAALRLPLDVAVIPLDITPSLAEAIHAQRAAGAAIRVHQHGYAHTNHEVERRKCEFGPARSAAAQRSDIEAGWRLLRSHFPDCADPIFTPPWNRCTDATVEALVDCGFKTLSRDASAKRFDRPGLNELSVSVDWQKRKYGELVCVEHRAELASQVLRTHPVAGLMLHHETLQEKDWQDLQALLELLAGHPKVEPRAMKSLTGEFSHVS